MKKHKKIKHIRVPIYFYIDEDNKKVYECDVCDKIHILEIDKRKEEK